LARLARSRTDPMTFVGEASAVIGRVVPFDRSCWHTVDPGTVLFTGSINRNVSCAGSWLAEHEYVIEDVNKWWFLARSGRRAGATRLATHGDLSRSARHRSHQAYGIGDELRASFVAEETYWGAAGFLRDDDRPWFTEDDVQFLASLSDLVGRGLRRALVNAASVNAVPAVAGPTVTGPTVTGPTVTGPGVVVFDEHGHAESISLAAERWIAEMLEEPRPAVPHDSRIIQAVAARLAP
jgi:hypothetical protein